MSIGDKEVWRDFVVEMEITIVQGSCELFMRLSPAWQKNVESRELTTDEGGLEAGRTYTYRFTVIASDLTEQIGEGDPAARSHLLDADPQGRLRHLGAEGHRDQDHAPAGQGPAVRACAVRRTSSPQPTGPGCFRAECMD
jgi:hypothetical protein